MRLFGYKDFAPERGLNWGRTTAPPGRKELAAAAVPGFNAAMPQPIRNNRAVTGQTHLGSSIG
jgi:hypothetical protein